MRYLCLTSLGVVMLGERCYGRGAHAGDAAAAAGAVRGGA